MRHDHTKEIDGRQWTVTEFPATAGLKIWWELQRALGPAILSVIAEAWSKGDQGAATALAAALSDVSQKISPDQIVDLCKRLLQDTRCDGKEVLPQFDLLFVGGYLTLLKVCAYVVEVNYKIPLADKVRDLMLVASPLISGVQSE